MYIKNLKITLRNYSENSIENYLVASHRPFSDIVIESNSNFPSSQSALMMGETTASINYISFTNIFIEYSTLHVYLAFDINNNIKIFIAISLKSGFTPTNAVATALIEVRFPFGKGG